MLQCINQIVASPLSHHTCTRLTNLFVHRYALTEGAFWIGSVPFAIAAVTLATGSLPDFASDEGKAAIGADAFIFINFARLIVPARIAFALGLAPWVDENIVKKFGGDEKEE